MDTAKMTEQLKAVWNKITTRLKGVSKKVWIILCVLIVLAAAAIAYYLNTRPYSILVTEVTPSELTTVMNWLNDRGETDYKIEANNTIMVPARKAAPLRASLLTEQYSSNSSGFSGYFANVSALSTEKERGTAFIIALQEEIANVARSYPGVVDATVLINEGEDLNYVLDHNNIELGSVGITLTMSGNQRLTDAQVAGLKNFVAHGVKGMSADRVHIGDTFGEYDTLSMPDGSTGGVSAITASEMKIYYKERYENSLARSVRQLLNDPYGAGNYSVVVNCDLDVDVREIDEHQIVQPDETIWGPTGGMGLIGSRVGGYTFRATPEAAVGGVVGTTSNAAIPIYVELGPDGNAIVGFVDGNYQTDYVYSTKDIHTYASSCRVNDVTLALTINATTATANGQAVDVANIRRLVASAVGIVPIATETMTAEEYLASKINILVTPYYVNPTDDPNPQPNPPIVQPWIIYAAIAGLALFVILLIVLLLVLRRRKKKKQKEQAALEQQQELERLLAAGAAAGTAAGPGAESMGADVMSLQSEKSMELRQSIRKFAEENPEIAAQMVKGWLRGGEESA